MSTTATQNQYERAARFAKAEKLANILDAHGFTTEAEVDAIDAGLRATVCRSAGVRIASDATWRLAGGLVEDRAKVRAAVKPAQRAAASAMPADPFDGLL